MSDSRSASWARASKGGRRDSSSSVALHVVAHSLAWSLARVLSRSPREPSGSASPSLPSTTALPSAFKTKNQVHCFPACQLAIAEQPLVQVTRAHLATSHSFVPAGRTDTLQQNKSDGIKLQGAPPPRNKVSRRATCGEKLVALRSPVTKDSESSLEFRIKGRK